jgi:hypothetical protein
VFIVLYGGIFVFFNFFTLTQVSQETELTPNPNPNPNGQFCGAKLSGSFRPSFFLPRMKRQRENRLELEEEIAAIKVKIEALEAEKAEWKTKAEAAEKAGRADEAKEHLGQLASVQQQLASLQNRLYLKEAALVADESMVKREKGTDLGNAFLFAHYTF